MCNNICYKFQVSKSPNESMFELGFVRCNYCNVYLEKSDCNKNKGNALLCPCCNLQVRSSPRCKRNIIKVRL